MTKQPNEANNIKPSDSKRVSLCGPTPADLNTAPGKDGYLVPLFEGLDIVQYPVTTKSKMAQRYFNQGFMLNYAFNHAEEARSFREAIRQDPECAMCYWGVAYVLGPNYNAGMETDVLPMALEALANAKLHMYNATPKEQALILALDKRYPKSKTEEVTPYYQDYAESMKAVRNLFPDDVDIAAMTAEALMDLHPWDLWQKDGTPQPWTPEILELVEWALRKEKNHPQAIHLYIHAMEAAPNPEKALEATHRLRFLVPGSGHLTHMPSHLYINTGHYYEGTLANERAVKIDSAYVEACHAGGIYPLAYYPHNWHFLAACAALAGKGDRAIEASRYMADFTVNHELMYDPVWGGLQHYYSIPWFVMVKFAKWDDILVEKQPNEKLIYPNIIWQYARGMAYAAKKDFGKAEAALAQAKLLAQDESIKSMKIWEINSMMDVVDIAINVLEGEIAHQKGEYSTAIQLLQKAVAQEDQLSYNEPPDWFFSVRHLLGDVLLKAGNYAEAEQIYQEDLKELKENGWALMGLYQSLIKQDKQEEANEVLGRYKKAWQYAEVELSSSVL